MRNCVNFGNKLFPLEEGEGQEIILQFLDGGLVDALTLRGIAEDLAKSGQILDAIQPAAI